MGGGERLLPTLHYGCRVPTSSPLMRALRVLSPNVGLPASSPPAQWGLLGAVPLAGPRAGPLCNIAQQDPYRLLPSCPLMRGPWGEGVYYLGGGLLETTVAMRMTLKMGSHVTSDPHWPGQGQQKPFSQLSPGFSWVPCRHMQMLFFAIWFFNPSQAHCPGSVPISVFFLCVLCAPCSLGEGGLLPGQLQVGRAQGHMVKLQLCLYGVSVLGLGGCKYIMFCHLALSFSRRAGGLHTCRECAALPCVSRVSSVGLMVPPLPSLLWGLTYSLFWQCAPRLPRHPWTSLSLPLWHLHLQGLWASQTSRVQSWTLELPPQPRCLIAGAEALEPPWLHFLSQTHIQSSRKSCVSGCPASWWGHEALKVGFKWYKTKSTQILLIISSGREFDNLYNVNVLGTENWYRLLASDELM